MKARVLGLLALPLLVAVVMAGISASTTSAQSPTNATLVAVLLGSEEVPGPGDPHAIGFALVTLNAESGQVCSMIFAELSQPASAAHIHRGLSGTAGPILIHFEGLPSPEQPLVVGCTWHEDRELIERIIANPGNYYVNVHTEEFPMGAIRGQLR